MTTPTPIELDFKSAAANVTQSVSLRTFTSYSFERSIVTPASAFRFSAPGVEKDKRLAIRSGDTVSLFALGDNALQQPLAVGYVDETDTHILPSSVDYILTGRDTIGQLVDNDSVDAQNSIVNTTNISLEQIFKTLIANTRMPQEFIKNFIPNGNLLFQTRPGASKLSALQQYLDFTNCLVWSNPDGRAVIGKPNFAQGASGKLTMMSGDPSKNNLIEVRVKRNLTQVIRQIVTQLQTNEQVDAGAFTVANADPDVRTRAVSLVGRSLYRLFSYGNGVDAVNQIKQVGNSNGDPKVLGRSFSLREIARENMKVLDVEAVIGGTHLNESGFPYNIDQIYDVAVEDENVLEPMYVYSVSFELTVEHGMITRLRLCRLGSICADSGIIQATNQSLSNVGSLA